MLAAQRGHLEHILTEAHAGREPVSMPATAFSKLPEKGTDWHRVAKEVEAGKCRGGLFNLDGSLIERFENLAETVGKEAQKKTTSFAERVAKTSPAPTGCRPGFTTIAAVSLGAVAVGWAAWHLMRNNGQTQPQATQANSALDRTMSFLLDPLLGGAEAVAEKAKKTRNAVRNASSRGSGRDPKG
jgi:hypothetical protein